MAPHLRTSKLGPLTLAPARTTPSPPPRALGPPGDWPPTLVHANLAPLKWPPARTRKLGPPFCVYSRIGALGEGAGSSWTVSYIRKPGQAITNPL